MKRNHENHENLYRVALFITCIYIHCILECTRHLDGSVSSGTSHMPHQCMFQLEKREALFWRLHCKCNALVLHYRMNGTTYLSQTFSIVWEVNGISGDDAFCDNQHVVIHICVNYFCSWLGWTICIYIYIYICILISSVSNTSIIVLGRKKLFLSPVSRPTLEKGADQKNFAKKFFFLLFLFCSWLGWTICI